MNKIYAICVEQQDFEAVESQVLFSDLDTALFVLDQINRLYVKLVDDCFSQEVEYRAQGKPRLPLTFRIQGSQVVNQQKSLEHESVCVCFSVPKAYWQAGPKVTLFSTLFDEYVSQDHVKQEIKQWLQEDCDKKGLPVSSFWSSFDYCLQIKDIRGITYSVSKIHALEVH